MTQAQLFDALDGLHAFEAGATCSGVRDARLRAEVFTRLRQFSPPELRDIAWSFLREKYPSAAGYTLEDDIEFLEWLSDCVGGK